MSFPGMMNSYVEACTLLEKTRVPDGEGGWVVGWNDGMQFDAAIVMDNTIQARVAESSGMRSVYTVTTEKANPLDFHDVFRRERDGQVFRVTSSGDEKVTPGVASFSLSQVSAEQWSLSS